MNYIMRLMFSGYKYKGWKVARLQMIGQPKLIDVILVGPRTGVEISVGI